MRKRSVSASTAVNNSVQTKNHDESDDQQRGELRISDDGKGGKVSKSPLTKEEDDADSKNSQKLHKHQSSSNSDDINNTAQQSNERDLCRYLCVKLSWKGKYRRIISITPSFIRTLDPNDLSVTNSWSLSSELAQIGAESDDVLVLHFKQIAKNNTKSIKFATKQRARLIADLHLVLRLTQPEHVQSLFSSPVLINCARLRSRGRWQMPATLRLTATTIERTDHTNLVAWSVQYRMLTRIEVVTDADAAADVVFAIILSTGERPKIFATDEWNTFEKAFEKFSLKNAGVSIPIVNTKEKSTSNALLKTWEDSRLSSSVTVEKVVANKEESKDTKSDQILGQWTVHRVKSQPGLCVGGVLLRSNKVMQMTQKVSQLAHNGGKRFGRTLSLHSKYFVERRADSFKVLNVRCLANVTAIVRSEEEAQMVSIEFDNGEPCLTYALTQRDNLISSLIGAVESARGHSIPVLPSPTGCGEEIVRDVTLEDEDYNLEPLYVKILTSASRELTSALTANLGAKKALVAVAAFVSMIREFNATIPYAGLSINSQISEAIFPALLALLPSPQNTKKKQTPAPNSSAAVQYTTVLQTLRRLTGATTGTSCLLNTPGAVRKIFASLDSGNEIVSIEATRLLAAICRGERGPSGHESGLFGQLAGHLATAVSITGQNKNRQVPNKADARAVIEENVIRVAKMELLAGSDRVGHLMKKLTDRNVSQLMSLAIVDLVEGLACSPHRKTTEEVIFHDVLKHSVSIGRPMFNLFQHPAMRVRFIASKLMRVISEHGARAAKPMREAAMKEGALLMHLNLALFSDTSSSKDLSRELVALWCDEFPPAIELLERIFPQGLMQTLKKKHGESNLQDCKVEQQTQEFGHGYGHAHKIDWISTQLILDWSKFWIATSKNHNKCNVIWNDVTRKELRTALETAIDLLENTRRALGESAASQEFTWNYAEFSVSYPSLKGMIVENGVYVKIFVDAINAGEEISLEDAGALYHSLWMRFLTGGDLEVVPFLNQIEISDVHKGIYGDSTQRELCIISMTALYRKYGTKIGHVTGIGHLIWLLDCTMDHRLRHLILNLLDELASTSSNSSEMVEHGAVDVFVDLACTAHSESVLWAVEMDDTQSNGILKEWYYQHTEDDKSEIAVGPISKAEIASAYKENRVSFKTKFRAEGMTSWKPFCDLRELRWLVSKASTIKRPKEVAYSALRILHKLVSLQTPDELVIPYPRVHRELLSERNFPRVIQLLLLDGTELVPLVASLIEAIVVFNKEVKERLYLKGLYFFALAYGGSNLKEISSLLYKTHRQQQTLYDLKSNSVLSGMLPESLMYTLDTYGSTRFSEVFIADVESPELIWTHKMRQEVLLPHVRQHISDFVSRLPQNFHLVYDYCPIPPIKYNALEREMWCHRYYLRHFCDIVRFPNTNVIEHVEFLQSLLSLWRDEMLRTPAEEISYEEAVQILGLEKINSAYISENDIRKAYRRLAIKYHPDKNPAGKDRFIEIQKAYDRLLTTHTDNEGGPKLWRLELLLEAQCIIYRRYPDILSDFKYGGFAMVLETLNLKDKDLSVFSTVEGRLMVRASELSWLTCVASSNNGDELIRSGAMKILRNLLSFCVSTMKGDVCPHESVSKIVLFLLRLFCGISAMERGSNDICNYPGTLWDIMYCCSLNNATKCVNSAVNCISQMASSDRLQTKLVDMGVLFVLLPLILDYDVTLEHDAGRTKRSDSTIQNALSDADRVESENIAVQQEVNFISMMAVRCIGRLAGILGDKFQTSENLDMMAALKSLLTTELANRVAELDPRDMLKELHSDRETPHLIWNDKMRLELHNFLRKNRNLESRPDAIGDMKKAMSFQFEYIKKELLIGNVYVRIFNEYNEDPTNSLHDQVSFMNSLLEYFSGFVDSLVQKQIRSKRDFAISEGADLIAVLDALQNLVGMSPKLASVFCSKENVSTFLCVLHPKDANLFEPMVEDLRNVEGLCLHVLYQKVLKLLNTVIGNTTCHDILSTAEVVSKVIRVAFNPEVEDCIVTRSEALNVLSAIPHTEGFATAAANHGGVLFLLSILLPEERNARVKSAPITKDNRLMAAKILEKASHQKAHGLEIVYILKQLFQEGFVFLLLKGDHTSFINSLDEEIITPERIWNQKIKAELETCIETLAMDAFNSQSQANCTLYSISEDFRFESEAISKHPEYGGVYLDLYLKDSRFPLSYPRKFLEAAMKSFIDIGMKVASDPSEINLALQLSSAIISLFIAQPHMIDHGVSLGYMTNLLTIVSTDGSTTDIRGSSLRVIHQMVNSTTGAQAFATCNKPYAIPALVVAMDWGLAGSIVALETLKRALNINNRSRDVLVAQSLSSGLLQRLIEAVDWNSNGASASDNQTLIVLEASGTEKGTNRVLCIEVLKLLALEGRYGSQIHEKLSKIEAWTYYADQKLDLFLPQGSSTSSTGVVGALTGGTLQTFALPAPESKMPNDSRA